MLLYLLRHGVTEWNREKKIQGRADIPLAEEGIRLARLTGKALKDVPFDLCFTSPLSRAVRTAREVLGDRDIPVLVDERLQEIDFGEIEGIRYKDDQGNVLDERIRTFFEDPLAYRRPEGGENIEDILKRTREFWLEKTEDPLLRDRTILISSHGCAVRALLQNVYRDPEHFWHGSVPPNCCINIIRVSNGMYDIVAEDLVFHQG